MPYVDTLSPTTVFQDEREKLLDSLPQPKCNKSKKSHGKIGFAGLARTIADKWKVASSSTKAYYEQLAAKEKRQYALDMIKWAQEQEESTPEPVARVEEQAVEAYSSVNPDNSVQEQMPYAEAPVSSIAALQESFPSLDKSLYQPYCYEGATSWNQSNPKMEAQTPVAPQALRPSTDSSAEMLNSFLEQPGMADLVSQMYQLLAQRVTPVATAPAQQTCGYAQRRRSSMRPVTLHRKSIEMCFNDPLLGNLEPLDQNQEIDEDATNWIGQVFSSSF